MSSARTTTKKPRARPISQVEWEKYRKDFEELYVNQGKSLEKVAAMLHKRYGFDPQKCQFKAQIKRWGFKKNTCRKDRSRLECHLSMQPSKEQTEYWISHNNEALLLLDTLGYEESLHRLVLLSAANEMFLEGNSDLVEHLQRKATAFKERPYNLTQISDDSPTGLILSITHLDYDSWVLVLWCFAKIASIVPATDLTIPVCATPEHHCCTTPTWTEKRFSPQCQRLFNQPTMILLLGLLFAFEEDSRLAVLHEGYLLRSALGSVERQLPTTMKHARRLKPKAEGTISSSDLEIDNKYFDYFLHHLVEFSHKVNYGGFVIKPRE